MESKKWLIEISPKTKLVDLNLKEVWAYRDLLFLFVKRDVVTLYKQTVLGPLWYFIQPLFTMVIFTVIFNKVAGIQTGKVPPYLFNLGGIVVWNYFRDCLTATSDTFKKNEAIFGKVYFPRIIMPMSIVVSNLLKFGIQFLIFIAFYSYFIIAQDFPFSVDKSIVFLPFLILVMGMLSLGIGMIISSMVTKYRDLTFLISFGVQLLLYVSAVMYPISLANEKLEEYAWVVNYNPMAQIIETARYMFLSTGDISEFGIAYTIVFSVTAFILGIIIFNKTEKSFIDTI